MLRPSSCSSPLFQAGSLFSSIVKLSNLHAAIDKLKRDVTENLPCLHFISYLATGDLCRQDSIR